MKKSLIILTLLLSLMIGSVMGAVSIVSNETVTTSVSGFLASVEVNETSTSNFFVSQNSDCSNHFYNDSAASNDTTFLHNVGGLAGETDYYWKQNGTSLGAVYNTPCIIATTNDYLVTGLARPIVSILSLVLAAMGLLFVLLSEFSQETKLRSIIYILVTVLIINALLLA